MAIPECDAHIAIHREDSQALTRQRVGQGLAIVRAARGREIETVGNVRVDNIEAAYKPAQIQTIVDPRLRRKQLAVTNFHFGQAL